MRGSGILIIISALLPFGNLFHSIHPIEIGGISIYSIYIPFVTWFFMVIININNHSLKDKFILVIFFYILSINILLRDLVFNGDMQLIFILFNSFQLYLPPIFVMVFINIDLVFKKRMLKAIKTILILQGIFSLLYMLQLPTINILLEDHFKSGAIFRYVGIFSGANVNSNFNSLLVTIILFGDKKITFVGKLAYLIIGFISIIPSLSRLPFIVLIILSIYTLLNLNYLTKHVIKFSFIIISICVVAFFFKNTINEFKIFGRFLDLILNGDQSGRMVKNATAITLINGSYIHYLIGVPTRLYAETSVSISDNAVLMRFLDSGVFFCLIYISLVFMQLHVKYRPTLNMYLYKIIILVTCLLNNATAWIPWVYFSILGYFIIIENEKV